MDRLKDQSRQQDAQSAAAPTPSRKFALRGSFSVRSGLDVVAEPAMREADGLVSITGPGLHIEMDPRRVDFDLGHDSVTISCGQPRLGDSQTPASARDLARAIQRSSSARWNELRGRFALVHLDLRKRLACLVTDRFGVHPLCFSYEDGTLAFSDRADAVPSPATRTLDKQAIFNYVYFHVIAAPRTIFSGVRRVEPAQVVTTDARGLRADFWWRPEFVAAERRLTDALKTRFRDLVRNAVEREATTPHVGSFLSGGTDSSTIAGFLREISGRQTPTFSIGFDAAGYDEIAYARLAARHFGTQQTEYYITPDDLVRSIPAVAASYDQPFGNSSALPAYYCSLQAGKAGVDKLLAGDGGDELFGGNLRYAKQKVFEAYSMVPSLLRASLIEPLLLGVPGVRRLPLAKKVASYIEQARIRMPDRMETYNLLDRFGASAVFDAPLLSHVDHGEPSALQSSVYARQQATSVVDRMLAYDWRFTLADNDLPKVIGTSSLAGLSVGFPLLDDDLVDFSLQLAPALKVRGLTLRYFFKEALRGFLPDEIIRKSKHGFGLPFGPWLLRSAALHECARSALESLARRGIVRGEFVGELFSTRLREHAGYFGEMIWILMMLEYWIAANAPSFSVQ
jgi:asparagine synthase (glutamine-hydrolysing)